MRGRKWRKTLSSVASCFFYTPRRDAVWWCIRNCKYHCVTELLTPPHKNTQIHFVVVTILFILIFKIKDGNKLVPCELLLWLHCSAVVFFHDMRMSPWTNLITPTGLKDSATFVSLEGKGQEFMTYGGRWSLITLTLVSSHNIMSGGLTPVRGCVCVSDTSGVTWRVWRAMCVTYKERTPSLLPSRPEGFALPSGGMY